MSNRKKPDPAIIELEQLIQHAYERADKLARDHGVIGRDGAVDWDKLDAVATEENPMGVAIVSAAMILGEIDRLRGHIKEEGHTAFVALRCLQIGKRWTMIDAEEFMAAGGASRRGSYRYDEPAILKMWGNNPRPSIEKLRKNAPLKLGGTAVAKRETIIDILKFHGAYP